MAGRWRLFRHDAGREAGPPPAAYVLLFVLCLLLGQWSANTFQAVIVWPANGVMLAALLQLRRRKAIAVLLICAALNLGSNVLRGDSLPFLWSNVVLNFGQVLVAGVLARRIGGAALDMRRPRRLFAFAAFAAAPAVFLTTTIAVAMGAALKGYTAPMAVFVWQHMFSMELLGLLTVTPSLLLLARAHRFREEHSAGRLEAVGLFVLLVGVTAWVFSNPAALAMLVLPPLMLIALRMSPPWTALGAILVMVISGVGTLTGHGPIMLTPVAEVPDLAGLPQRMRLMGFYHAFLLALVIIALPLSAVMSERRRLIARLQFRTKAAIEAKSRAERSDAAKSRFLALMSHEMRTPLNGIAGYADLLSRRDDVPVDARPQIEAISRSGEAMLMLVEDVLEFSRGGEEVVSEPLAVTALLDEAAAPSRLNAEAKGLPLTLIVEPAAKGGFSGDRRRLRQALHHLISNAVKFTDQGEVRVTARHDGAALTVEVSDTGCGIDPGFMPRLFDAFAQSDDSLRREHIGAGVGLPLALAQVRRMGGRIVVDSRPERGSIFTLSVPLAPVAVTPDAAPPADAERAMRVLIVDDHPVNREMMRLMLAAADCETVEAADGVEAVEQARAGDFDLILMDLRMPRLDGLAATERIRALDTPAAAAPILAVTADAMPEDAARCRNAGMDGHLAKPITHVRLYAAIDQALKAAAVRMDRAA